jgi:hypothetical protein
MNQVNRGLEIALKQRNCKILFSAQDIPVYHFMPFRELTLFKLYTWNKGLYGNSQKFENFFESYYSEEIGNTFDAIYSNYKKIPSLELWTSKTIDPLIQLIDYYYQIGSFASKETPLLLYQQIEKMLDNLGNWAETGKKGENGSNVEFEMYLSEIDLDNSFVLIQSEQQQMCMLKLFTINSIITTNPSFCNETELWFNNLIKKSQCISRMSQKDHYKFFNSLNEKVFENIKNVR